ncbi:MAG: DUF1700 domain-containing protein [Candidatus Izimaplasma sp.]|nr:DUF1700 domain-containing protein [Candidatus Izimaplasma bacterium]
MKTKFLKELKMYLNQYDIKQEIVKDIVNDHKEIIEDAVASGQSEEEIIEKLGNPRMIAKELRNEKKNRKQTYDETFIALSPFIAVIAYMLMGFLGEMWHPGWLVFLIIPLTGLIVSVRRDGWQILLTSIAPFIAVGAFIIMGEYYDLWHPGWLVFLIVPFVGYTHHSDYVKRYVSMTGLLVSVGLYLFIILTYSNTEQYAWLVFLIPAIIGIIFGDITFVWHSDFEETPKSFLMIIIVALITFIVLGLMTSLWHPLWLILLTIPVGGILLFNENTKKNLIGISPFIALTAFILIGEFVGAWHIAWLVFLIIPMVGIISSANEK